MQIFERLALKVTSLHYSYVIDYTDVFQEYID